MATPNEKLAASLEILKERQEKNGNVLRNDEFSRTHRDRLKKTGFLRDVIRGWLIVSRPQDGPHDPTSWYVAFWGFCRLYCHVRFGSKWCLSPEHSLLLHAESTQIPKQLIIWTPKGSGNKTVLPFDTSLYDLKKDMPPESDIFTKDDLIILSVDGALIKVSESFYRTYPTEAQIVLNRLGTITPLLVRLLDGGHVLAAGRIAGALRRMDRITEADTIIRKMKIANHDVREKYPFADIDRITSIEIGTSPLVVRINAAWNAHRDTIVGIFPDAPSLPNDKNVYLAAIDDIYVNDAYHSLSIEGYRASKEQIDAARQSVFDPQGNSEHKKDADALPLADIG